MLWKNKILQSLEERDFQQHQQQSDPMFISYNIVVERLFSVENKLAVFQQSDLQVELQKCLAEIDTLKGKMKNLTDENQYIAKIKASQEKEIKHSKHKMKKLEDNINRLTEKLKLKQEENQAKNKIVNQINDDILVLQLENGILNDKMKQLENENNQLVARWMNKVKEDAEKLNDANAFLENVRLNGSSSEEMRK